MAIQIVYTSGSGHVRGFLQDCDGNTVTREMVTDIRVNIFRKYLGEYIPIDAYMDKSIPLTAILEEVKIDHDQKQYNVDFDPFDGINSPFPVRNAGYVIEVIFQATTGERSVHQVEAESR